MAAELNAMAFVKSPNLKSTLLPERIKFETAHAQYVRETEDMNSQRDEDSHLRVLSIQNCMDRRILQSLCILGNILHATTIGKETDQNIKAWFDTALAETTRTLSVRLNAAASKVSYKKCDEDPAGAGQGQQQPPWMSKPFPGMC